MKKTQDLLKELSDSFLILSPFINENVDRLNELFINEGRRNLSNKDTILITYADQFSREGESPLKTLGRFIDNDLDRVCNIVHVLPFYPWTSDDGFSPIDYKSVELSYGDWSDIESLSGLKMFDCVFNHLSSSCEFFQKALSGEHHYQEMFHFFSEDEFQKKEFQENIKKVVRPRTSPLLTQVLVNGEPNYVWTTFGPDQIDTNLSNIDFVRYLLEALFLYIEKGARFLRIDAVPFFWKELGTNCSHHPKTHTFVQLLRSIVDRFNFSTWLITESNVPHLENISYWGNGTNEAHVIYNFSLAPLLLHALTFQTNRYFTNWVQQVYPLEKGRIFLNFTATHDGIGLRGLEGIVPENDLILMCERTVKNGGRIGLKKCTSGLDRPYEMNTTWSDYLRDEELQYCDQISLIVNSHALVMFLPGITAHYIHNFIGLPNWSEGLRESGIPRRLNRRKFKYPMVYSGFSESIKEGLKKWIKKKCEISQFHPEAGFSVVQLDERIISFTRKDEDGEVLVLFNLSSRQIELDSSFGILCLGPYELNIKNL